MVILQNIPEKGRVNRGSKSASEIISYICVHIRNNNMLEVVKEQRVDGSCIILNLSYC